MTETIHNIAAQMLDIAIETDDWDEMPMLFLMAEPAFDAPPEQEYQLVLIGISDGHPAEFMEKFALAASLGRMPGNMIPTTKLVGIALQNEAWGLRAETKADGKAVQAYTANGGMISDHPLRIEMKVSVSYDGTDIRWAEYQRGAESKNDVPGERIEGRIPDSMRAMFHAINQLSEQREDGS